ncbi:hypothetical protein J7S33_08550, partial [Saccharothrix algeriensis]
SWSLILYLASRLGEPGLVAAYRRIAGEGRPTDPARDALVREATGVEVAELVRGWQGFLREGFP